MMQKKGLVIQPLPVHTPKITCLLCLWARMLMLGQRHYVHIASLLILCPVDIICHLRFRIELYAFKDMLYESLITNTVNQMSDQRLDQESEEAVPCNPGRTYRQEESAFRQAVLKLGNRGCDPGHV